MLFRQSKQEAVDNVDEETDKRVYHLQNNLGSFVKRTEGKEAVIKYPRFSKENEPERYYGNILTLFLPHRSTCKTIKEFDNPNLFIYKTSTNCHWQFLVRCHK